MPLMRYRVGDQAIASTSPSCSCGRRLALMDGIQGRDSDVIITPSGNRLIVHFFTGILEYFGDIDSFQVVQKEKDSMLVRVTIRKGSEFTRELETSIVRALQEKGANGMKISIEPVLEIPATKAGKRRFVISELPRVEIT